MLSAQLMSSKSMRLISSMSTNTTMSHIYAVAHSCVTVILDKRTHSRLLVADVTLRFIGPYNNSYTVAHW